MLTRRWDLSVHRFGSESVHSSTTNPLANKWRRNVSKPLNKKVSLVPGGSRGIGAAIALQLAHDGADVSISHSASAERAESVVKSLKALGVRAAAFQADQADAQQVVGLLQQAVEAFGRIDILVNNAGTLVPSPVN